MSTNKLNETYRPHSYDVLELQKMTLGELYNLALWFQVDTLNKPKQEIIREILGAQEAKFRSSSGAR